MHASLNKLESVIRPVNKGGIGVPNKCAAASSGYSDNPSARPDQQGQATY
jgi:hypothetical protein